MVKKDSEKSISEIKRATKRLIKDCNRLIDVYSRQSRGGKLNKSDWKWMQEIAVRYA
jgi:hypothetical protein